MSDTKRAGATRLRQSSPRAETPKAATVKEIAVDQALSPQPSGWSRLFANRPYKDVIDSVLKTLLVITVFLGGYEYFSRQQAARVEKSLALVDEWQANQDAAMQRINDLIWPLYSSMAADIEAAAGEPDVRARLLGNLGDAVTGRDDDFTSAADRDVDAVFDFFDRAGLCANERICDYDVIETFLGEEARSFWLYFSRYAERRQAAGYASYGIWTARFAEARIARSWFGII